MLPATGSITAHVLPTLSLKKLFASSVQGVGPATAAGAGDGACWTGVALPGAPLQPPHVTGQSCHRTCEKPNGVRSARQLFRSNESTRAQLLELAASSPAESSTHPAVLAVVGAMTAAEGAAAVGEAATGAGVVYRPRKSW